MTRDYKPTQQKPGGKGSPFLTGLLIGLLLGIGAAVGVAVMVKGGDNPFVDRGTQAPSIAAGTAAPGGVQSNPDAAPPEAKPADKRFTFYGILEGSEKQVTEQEVKQAQAAKPEGEKAAGENYFLQVGAFQSEQDADNMKAKLALLGLEAVIQTANIPDKGVWHRVRVGPFTQLDEINKTRTELARNNIESTLLKIHGDAADQ